MIVSERRGTELRLLTLQRPEKRNVLTQALIEQLTAELQRSDADPAIRGVILAGAGPSFCAGVDLHEFAEATPDSARALIVALSLLCATVRGLSKPGACAAADGRANQRRDRLPVGPGQSAVSFRGPD